MNVQDNIKTLLLSEDDGAFELGLHCLYNDITEDQFKDKDFMSELKDIIFNSFNGHNLRKVKGPVKIAGHDVFVYDKSYRGRSNGYKKTMRIISAFIFRHLIFLPLRNKLYENRPTETGDSIIES